ncbi:hypothetical protein RJT34_04391 [Clitoria ternatea]|uniref:Uncharacterized protein n=1 Tax=Clitoria ternatea TaxID=43366 RepID=A0AAN9Q639_CLITE
MNVFNRISMYLGLIRFIAPNFIKNPINKNLHLGAHIDPTKKCNDHEDFDFSIFPSSKVSDRVMEPFNATLFAHQLFEKVFVDSVSDGESLVECSKECKSKLQDLDAKSHHNKQGVGDNEGNIDDILTTKSRMISSKNICMVEEEAILVTKFQRINIIEEATMYPISDGENEAFYGRYLIRGKMNTKEEDKQMINA